MIEQFRGDFDFLSNFARLETSLKYDGLSYPTVEHFYVAMKTTDKGLREQVSNHSLKGLKSFGRGLPLRDDWDEIRLEVMKYGTSFKYSKFNPILRQRLLDTGSQQIQEGSYWNDKFFGVCLKTNTGENHLGKILMWARGNIQEELKKPS